MALKHIAYNGYDLKVHGQPGDYYFNDLSLGSRANQFLLNVVDRNVSAGNYALDIGAKIGLATAIIAKSLPASKVIAFEADPRAFGFLTETVIANDLSNCTPYQMGLGDRPGELTFTDVPDDPNGDMPAPTGRALRGVDTKVRVERLDEFLSELGFPKVDFIKLGAGGFELEVLRGATKTLSTFKPNLFLEFNSLTLITCGDRNPRELLDYLRTNFAFVYRFVEGKLRLIETSDDEIDFIRTNLFQHGCVDDLYCTHEAVPS